MNELEAETSERNIIMLSLPQTSTGVGGGAQPMPQKRRAAIYVRKSHYTEGKSKSLDDQIKDCRRVCTRLGIEVQEDCIYTEAEGCKGDWTWQESGDPGPYRPELGRMLADVQSGQFDAIVVWKSDRLYRDCGLADDILKRMRGKNVALICGGYDYHIETATGFARASLEAVTNREQRDKASEDVKRSLQERMAEGQITRSPACLGFRSAGTDSKDVISLPDELLLVNRIFRMFVIGDDERGPLGVTAIARQLMQEGVELPCVRRPDKHPTLKEIGAGTIARMLSHVAYIAKFKHAGVTYDCPALLVISPDGTGRKETAVPVALWMDAQDKLKRETKWDKKSDGLGQSHLLTGIIVCGYCGRTTYALMRNVKAGSGGQETATRSNFRCIHREPDSPCKKQTMPFLSEAVLEGWVLDELAPLLIEEIRETRTSAGRNTDLQALAQLKMKIEAAYRSETKDLLEKMKILDHNQFTAVAGALRAEREALVRQATVIQERLNRNDGLFAQIKPTQMKELPFPALRAALQSSLEWIMVCNSGVIALTRVGTYITACYRKGDPARGEHPNLRALEAASVADTLTCLSWFPHPETFIAGRRTTLGERSVGVTDEELLPGLTAFFDQSGYTREAYTPEFLFPEIFDEGDFNEKSTAKVNERGKRSRKTPASAPNPSAQTSGTGT